MKEMGLPIFFVILHLKANNFYDIIYAAISQGLVIDILTNQIRL